MTEAEQWQAYFDYAGALKLSHSSITSPHNVVGRSFAFLAKRAAAFWARHKDTIIPFLAQITVAAIEAFAAQVTNIQVIDPPGPN